MKFKKIYTPILTIFLTLILACNLGASSKKLASKDFEISCVSEKSEKIVKINAEIAKTQAERSRGFMERQDIPEGTGMLFIFEADQILSFWMKNTPHPLSIAYIDSAGKIRNIFDMTPFSLEPIKSTVSVRYALEVPQGWFDKNGIKIGDKIDLSPLN